MQVQLVLPLAAVLMSVLMIWIYPGASWFHQQLVPSIPSTNVNLETRTLMAIWQLSNCTLKFTLFFDTCD